LKTIQEILKPCETGYRIRKGKTIKKVTLQKAELTCNQYITELKEELLYCIEEGKRTHKPVLIEKGTTGNGGTSFFADALKELQQDINKKNILKVLILVPLNSIRQSKRDDDRYNIIDAKDPFELRNDKANITTYAKAYKHYNKKKTDLRDIIILFDEINSMKEFSDIKKMFRITCGLLKLNNVSMVLMTAYLDKFIREHIISIVKPICVNIKVLNNGYHDFKTYIANSNVFKNLDHICEGNLNRLVISTNNHKNIALLIRDNPDTVFQFINGETFERHIRGHKNAVRIEHLKNINPNLPLIYTSTIASGGDIYFKTIPEHSKILIIDSMNVLGNNNVNQAIGRIRDKSIIEKVYVNGRKSSKNENEVFFTDKYVELAIDERYSLALNGKLAEQAVFPANGIKFDIENKSLYTILKYGYSSRYYYWEYNKKEGTTVLAKNLINYLKYLKLKSLYPEYDDENNKEFFQKTLWKDWKKSCMVEWFGSKDLIETMFNRIDFNKDKEEEEEENIVTCNDAKENTKLKMRLRAEIDTVIIRNNGSIKNTYTENVRVFNSFTNLRNDYKNEILTRHNLYEYDIKNAYPRFLCFILHQFKDKLNSDDFDFYSHIAPKMFSGQTRDEVKKSFNKRLNGLSKIKNTNSFNKTLKDIINKIGFDKEIYNLLKNIVDEQGNCYRTLGALEDYVMGNLMHEIYEWFKNVKEKIKIIRLHDSIITTKPIPHFKVSINDYSLPLSSKQNTWRELPLINMYEYQNPHTRVSNWYELEPEYVEQRPCIYIKADYYTLYKDETSYEYKPVFSDETYKTFVENQKDIFSKHSECGLLGEGKVDEGKVNRNDIMYINNAGETFTRLQVSQITKIPIKDRNFAREAKKAGFKPT
jgi:hypothetical protein